MIFKLSDTQENELLHLPETGMGYQVVLANKIGEYATEKFLVLNSEIVVEMKSDQSDQVRRIISEGILAAKRSASIIGMNIISVLSEKEFRNSLNESKGESEKGAIDNPVKNADGEEVFVRLSAFDNDRRVDKVNLCLLPGSYTTTMDDYILCKKTNDDPVERYALPNDYQISYAFHIQPLKIDTLQRGKVQPANNKRGGGKEVYFAAGTSKGTYLKQTRY